MAKKPVDHDATMDVSMSQLVVDPPPKPAPRPAAGDKNDVSLWAYRVVGSDDFAPLPAAPKARVRGWLIAVLVLVTLGAGGVLASRYLL